MFEGIIYKITGRCGKVYIGSTTDYNQRKTNHNDNSNNTYSKKLLKPLQFEKIRIDNYNLIKTMLLVEQYYIDIYKCVNKNRAYQNRFTRRKYDKKRNKITNQNNKEERKRRYQNNKEEMRKKNLINYHNNKVELNKKKKS